MAAAVYLASASDHILVKALADRIGGIAGVFASEGKVNVAGKQKATALVELSGSSGFDYIGDRAVDFRVWMQARHALAVCTQRHFRAKVEKAPARR